MNTYYINLAEATERRAYLEGNFRQFAPRDWSLTRIPAVDAATVQAHRIPGAIRPSEIACLLSHRNAIAASLADPDNSLIVEDDALFGPSTFEHLVKLEVLRDPKCDLIFLSTMICDLGFVLKQIFLRRTLLAEGKTAAFDMSTIGFAGADAYIVKREAKQKVLDLLNGLKSIDLPYDLLLRHWVHGKQLTAALVFPCLTTLSPMAENSTNGNGNTTWHTLNALRRLQSYDAKDFPGNIMASIDLIEPDFYDVEAEQFSKVLRVLMSRKFVFG